MARRSRLLSPSTFLRNGAIYKGFLGPSRGWKIVGAFIFGRRFLKRLFGKTEETLTVETLKGGQFIRIDAVKPPSRRQRKKAEKAEAAERRRAQIEAEAARARRKVAAKEAKRAARADARDARTARRKRVGKGTSPSSSSSSS